MVQLFQQNIDGQVSCYICHLKIYTDRNGEINCINENFNYVVCENGHAVHAEPCLKNWLYHSNNCPVCHSRYLNEILTKFNSIIETEKKKAEEKRIAQQIIEQRAKELENLNKIEAEKEIEDKVNRANKLIEEKKYGPALNILFDILDNNDANNLDAKFLIGKTQYLSEKYDLAISNFMKLVKIKFDYPLGFYYLGKCFEKIGSKDKAKWAFERARENLKLLLEDSTKNDNLRQGYQQFLEEINVYIKNI